MNSKHEPILTVENLSNCYEGTPLLQDISFTLAKGEILCLLGPSGSGKTTLLRLIAGLEKETGGRIVFHGRDIRPVPPHQRNFGMMFQEYALFPHKNVWQNIVFGLEMQGCLKAEIDLRAQSMLQLMGLQGLEKRRIDELSGGERQRVALARSLAPEPRLLLLDEPLGSLDRTLRDRLTCEIRTILKKLAVTAIFVTHDQSEAFSVADKVAVLHNGILQQFDTPEGLYRQPCNGIVAAFLGFTNRIAGKIDANGTWHSATCSLCLPAPVLRHQMGTTLLIRPEGARITALSPATTAIAPQLSGIVTNRLFLGASYRISLLWQSHPLTFELPIDPPPPQVGEGISLIINPAALLLLD